MALPGISLWGLFALFGVYGLFRAATEGVEKALVADLAPAGLTGTAFGWFNLVAGVMLLPASLIFGWLYQAVGSGVAFLFSGTCALVAFILMAFWVKPFAAAARNIP
jgi:MFS family permease